MALQGPLYDLIVIGSGPAGQRAALQGAKSGKKVALVDAGSMVGGACVHYGTLPSKSFRESVYRYSLGSRGVLGSTGDEAEKGKKKKTFRMPEMSRLLKRKERVVQGETQVITDQLKRNHIRLYQGHAKFLSSHELEIESKKGRDTTHETITGEIIIIAVGARPVSPAHIEVDDKTIFDSDTILTLKEVPSHMVVLGGGIIGAEYASMFSMAGTEVILVDRRHEILASVDREIVNQLMHRFEEQGMEIVLGAEAVGIERKKIKSKNKTTTKTIVQLSNGRKLITDVVLVAQGRSGNTDGLGLETIGIERDARGLITVDKNFRTSVPNVYAAGDVIGSPALASTSMEQGRIATCHAFGIKTKTGSNAVHAEHEMPALYPYGIYTIPEISMIGKTEEELKAAKVDFVVGRARYKELARGQIVGDRWGILKLVVDRHTLKILGVHIVGDNAADLIHIGQAVMAFDGDVTYFINSVFNYPTLAEAYKTAAFHAVNTILGSTKTP
jgi:NAD(P) transhydrogenase